MAVIFPKNKFPIKLDPLWKLRYLLRLWGQRKDFKVLCLIILCVKMFGFVARSIFILHSLNDIEVLLEVSATYPIPLLVICQLVDAITLLYFKSSQAILKMAFLLFQHKKFNFLYNAIAEKFWDHCVGGYYLNNYLQKRYKLINYLLLGHILACVGYVIMHLLFAEVPIPEGRTRWLPTLISLPVNQDKSPLHETLYIVLSWNMFMSVFGNAFFDLLFVYASQHLCGQFMLLRELLKRLNEGILEHHSDVEKFKSKGFQKEVHKRVAICVGHHNLLLRYGKKLQDLTSVVFGVQLLTTLLTLVLMGYTLSENLEKLTKSTMLLSYVFSTFVQFSIFAVQSEDIYNQSILVAEAAYQSNWYLFNASVKRALTLLMMNSQKGISVFGAGLIEMNNEVIVKMAQKVFSFITLLQSLGEDK